MEASPCDTPRKASGPSGSGSTRQIRASQDAAAASQDKAVMRQIWRLYDEVVQPREETTFSDHFLGPKMTQEEFSARPQVLLLGQYSTGKTSMVKWMTKSENSHFDIRPQPSTDKFMAVVHGAEEKIIHGNAATCLPQLPYQGLSTFGVGFLDSFQALALPSDILSTLTFIDTPGVLAGSKQSNGRGYQFSSICEWMAARADLILLTFDAHKLDISDEFQEVMEVLKPYADKVRCVLNKADQIDAENLVRVYGALLWNVGKVLRTPEVARVYVSSFWDNDYQYSYHEKLFNEDKNAILAELNELPRTSILRKLNNFVARVRRVRALFCLVAHIREELPTWTKMTGGKDGCRQWVDDNLERLYAEAQKKRNLASGDMLDIRDFRKRLASFDHVKDLPKYDSKEIARLDKVIEEDVPAIMRKVGGVTTSQFDCMDEEPLPSPGGFRSLLGRLGFQERSPKRRRIDQ